MPGNSDGFAGTSDSQQPKSLIPLGETETHLDLSESEGEDPLQRAKPPLQSEDHSQGRPSPTLKGITRRGGRAPTLKEICPRELGEGDRSATAGRGSHVT
jgi:hypothetical protein